MHSVLLEIDCVLIMLLLFLPCPTCGTWCAGWCWGVRQLLLVPRRGLQLCSSWGSLWSCDEVLGRVQHSASTLTCEEAARPACSDPRLHPPSMRPHLPQVRFAHKEQVVLMADEVYQPNVYQDEKPFVSAKKVLGDLGAPYTDKVELASFHTVSKVGGWVGGGVCAACDQVCWGVHVCVGVGSGRGGAVASAPASAFRHQPDLLNIYPPPIGRACWASAACAAVTWSSPTSTQALWTSCTRCVLVLPSDGCCSSAACKLGSGPR